MKQFMLSLIFIGCSFQGMAQTVIQLPAEYLRNNVVGKNNVPENVQGSPYWDPEFKVGTISVFGRESYTAQLRYNAFNDEIEMEVGDGASVLLKRDYIRARIGTEQYQVEKYVEKSQAKQGYFISLNEGANRLLLRRTIVFREGKAAESSYDDPMPPRYDKTESYYISRDSSSATLIRLRKKDVLEAFDNDPKLQDYIKTEKLKLKTASEVVQVLAHLNNKQ